MMSPFLGEHLDKNDDSVWRMWKRIEEQRKQKTTHRGWPSSESSLPRLRPADQRLCLPIPWAWVAWDTCQVLSAQAELGGWEDDRVHCTDMFVRYVAARSQQLPTTVSHYTICSGKAKEYFRSKSCTCEDFKRRFGQSSASDWKEPCLHNMWQHFQQNNGVENHIKAVHYGEKPFECTIFFWEAKSERTHVNSHGEGWMNLPFVWQIHDHWAMRAQNIIAKEVLHWIASVCSWSVSWAFV